MAITLTWNASAPAGGDALSAGDDEIRNLKGGLVERLRNGGHRMQTSGATTNALDGLHVCGEAASQGLSGALTGEFYIFAADGTTVVATFRDSTASTPSELYVGANGVRSTGTIKAATLNATSLVKPDTDATVDLGVTATNRFRDLFLSRNATIGGTLNVTGVATFTAVPVFSGGSSFTTITVTSKLTLTGGYQHSFTTVASGSYTVLTTDHIIFCTVGGATTINLPAAATVSGYDFYITIPGQAGSPTTAVVDPNGAETIDNVATYTLRRQSSGDRAGVHIISDGTKWTVLSAFFVP